MVLWPQKMYEKEALRLLREPHCYKRLTFNPTVNYQSELRSLIQLGVEREVITEQQGKFLTIEYPRTSALYLLPKVHKNLDAPPGRPIVSGNGNMCEKISKFVDYFLQPIVATLPSHVKDTNDLLWKIDNVQLEPDMLMVTCDVESLYTSIRHQDGIQTTQSFLYMSDLDKNLCDFILAMLEFILMHTYAYFPLPPAPGNSDGGSLCCSVRIRIRYL